MSKIDNSVFNGCKSLSKITIPNSVKTIEPNAFSGCIGLTSIDIPNTVTRIKSGAFQGCSNLLTVVIPSFITEIETGVFGDCSSLNNITIPNSVTKICVRAFQGCSSLTSINLPKGIISIESLAFCNCVSLNTVYSYINQPFVIESSVFYDIAPNATIYVPFGTKPSYQNTNGWHEHFSKIIEMQDTQTKYYLNISATGNGSASYNSAAIRNATKTFTVNEGASATINITPDDGYKIKNVKKDGANVNSSVSNNKYTVSNIQSNTSVEVEFEAIPPTTYTLSITATGNGEASYNNTSIRNATKSFSINEGSYPSVYFYPDNGYRVKSVKINGNSSSDNVAITLQNVHSNNKVEVEFEKIPPMTYTLSIKATGNGSVSYNSTTIRNTTKSFTVNEGTSATISITPDDGYRIKSVKTDGTVVTSNVSNNKYTVSNIQSDTSIEVEFVVITHTLSIKASGNGSASYNSTTIRNTTKTFTVNEGTSATISITPDDGYRIKSVKKDGTDVTSSVSNNKYTLNNIQSDTSVEVEFEAITHILSIKATGNGVATYEDTNIRNKTISFTINEGSSAVVKFTPDNGCRIKSMKLNSTDVTSNVINNQYTISNITADMSLEVEFDAIPPTTYTLFIKATGNGSVSYNSTAIRNTTKSFTVNEGTSATISFTPDNGYHIKSVKVNNTGLANVESQVSIDNIMENTTVEVEFEANPTLFACEGINYSVTSYDNKTVRLAKGNYGKVLEVPSTISYMDTEWTVTGVDEDAFDNAEELAAIIWHPVVSFNATVVNPNLLLYVNKNSYAPISIKNVVVNGTASSITLTDAESGNNFYCPQEFTAQRVSYSHNYKMTTGIGVAKGWETIALPFDVQTVTHEEKGEIVPFTKWQSGNSTKPFWLMRLEENGWKVADGIKANTPYIISMPNNSEYKDEFLLNGRITFSAENVTVRKTENMQTSSYKGRTFVPTCSEQTMGSGLYVLNVDNDYETNVSGMDDGSHFVLNLRKVHPFEAYMVTSANGSRAIDISDGMDDGIDEEEQMSMRVYNLKGLMIKTKEGKSMEEIKQTLPSGVYIVNGHKMIVK